MTVKAKILQLRQVTKNVTVGYGATCEMPEGSRIATLSMGYADGYFRVLSNKGYCYIANTVVLVIGRVSMDLIMIDVTKVPESKLHIGAEVEVIGKHYTVDDMAKAAGTTGYEVLTRFGSRFVREYKGAE